MASIFLTFFHERPPDAWDDPTRERLIRGGGYVFLLNHASRAMPKAVRHRFPLLSRVDLQTIHHGPQRLLLSPAESSELLREFVVARDIYAYRHFESGLDSEEFRRRWREHHSEAEFQELLLEASGLLQQAVAESAWVEVST